jgi:excisionase family DNA binding protein
VDDLLTTRQLQDLLQVDRVTIYRMLNDGRLRGFKVGGQWRFSRREIEKWLEAQSKLGATDLPPLPSGTITPTQQTLPISCIQAIQAVCAEALDVACVTVDLEGSPLTEVSNSCEFCSLILSTSVGRRRCAQAWSVADNGQPHRCHAGLFCVSAPVEVSGRPVAITAACQFTGELPDDAASTWQADLRGLAADLHLDEADLETAADSIRVVLENHLRRVSSLVGRVADTFSEIGEERLNLLSRLQRIAEMSKI